MKHIVFMGIASGVGANDPGCRYAPSRVKKAITAETEMDLDWHAILHRRPGNDRTAELRGTSGTHHQAYSADRHQGLSVYRGRR